MKTNRKLFYASLLIFLLIFEYTSFLAITLGVALFIFDYLYTDDRIIRSKRLRLAGSMVIISAMALLAYVSVANALIANYNAGQYQSVPVLLKVIPLAGQQVQKVSTVGSLVSNTVASRVTALNIEFAIYGLATALFSFGFSVIFSPIVTLVLISQWFVEGFLFGFGAFIVPWSSYYAFVLGGTIVSSVLGITLAQQKKGFVARFLFRIEGVRYGPFIKKFVYGSFVVMSVLLTVLSPFFLSSSAKFSPIYDIRDFLLQPTAQQAASVAQIDSLIKLIPQNASLMTEGDFLPHFTNRQNIELLSSPYTYYFKPDYILFDFNANLTPDEMSQFTAMQSYVNGYLHNNTGQYSLIAQNGTAMLYKRIG